MIGLIGLMKKLKAIVHNGLAMKSSGFKHQNLRIRTKLNRIINLTVSNKAAIFYSLCYKPFLIKLLWNVQNVKRF